MSNKICEQKRLIIILGPTATGKTKLAVKLAAKFNGEIISADSRQVYQGLDVGTGKDLNEYKLKAQSLKFKAIKIPYHLIDIVSPKQQFSVAEYQKLAYQAIEEILKRGKVPFLVGGTGLYISAITEGYQFINLKSKISNLKTIRRKLDKLILKQLLARLKKIDPKTYKIIDKKNRRRVQRALEIYYQTGISKSQQLKKKKPPYQFLFLGITFPKKELERRIEGRLKHRLKKEGMINEVRQLHRQGISWQRLDEFGLEYRLVSRYLREKINYQQMFEELNKAIISFAKRQITWFKRNKEIRWVKNYTEAGKLVKKFLKI